MLRARSTAVAGLESVPATAGLLGCAKPFRPKYRIHVQDIEQRPRQIDGSLKCGLGLEHVFSILNRKTCLGNYESQVCKFLTFPCTARNSPLRSAWLAPYLIDGTPVTKRQRRASGLRIARVYARLDDVHRQSWEACKKTWPRQPRNPIL